MNNKKKLFKDIFKAVYVANIKGLIDENRYIQVLQTISDKGFKTYHVANFDRLTLHLKKIKLKRSYVISILLYLRDENLQKIIELSNYFIDVQKILHLKNKKMIEKVHIISGLFKEKMELAKSFEKQEKFEFIYNDYVTKMKLSTNKIRNEWYFYNRNDIIRRFHNLVERFNLDQLKYIGVELILNDDLMKMSNINIQNYYDRVIQQIITAIKSWQRTCLLYVDVELGYLESCHNINSGKEPCLNLKSFEINIC